MALVGVIKAGTIADLLRVLSRTKSKVLLLLERGEQFGHLWFSDGALQAASYGELSGEEALRALKRWTSGQYILKKEGEEAGCEYLAHVLVISQSAVSRRELADLIGAEGFETSVVAYAEHGAEVIGLLKPDAVVLECAGGIERMRCQELGALLKRSAPGALILNVAAEGDPCPFEDPACGMSLHPCEQMLALLRERWPRRGARAAAPSAAVPEPSSAPSAAEPLVAQSGVALAAPDKETILVDAADGEADTAVVWNELPEDDEDTAMDASMAPAEFGSGVQPVIAPGPSARRLTAGDVALAVIVHVIASAALWGAVLAIRGGG